MEAHSASLLLALDLVGWQELDSPRKDTQGLVSNFHKLNYDSGSWSGVN